MSRIHDALRKAAQDSPQDRPSEDRRVPASRPKLSGDDFENSFARTTALAEPPEPEPRDLDGFNELVRDAREVAFNPGSDSLLLHPSRPNQTPAEEFRTLRTRLNHLQSIQTLHTLVVTSASPAEGKSFTAANLALAQAQLADTRVLLADFDFRRPTVHKAFKTEAAPGITDYLSGQATLTGIMQKVAGVNLHILSAGSSVPNPLELLNLKECRALLDQVRALFDWVIIDSPPLLSAADANLLASMADGTVLVVRIGATTFDSVSRALQSLSENNVLGVLVNGAQKGELYNKYTYGYGNGSDKPQATDAPAEPGSLYWV